MVLYLYLTRNIIRNDSIWDKLVFKKIQQGLGGRVRLITTGSAPLSATVLDFLRCCVGCPVCIIIKLEVYTQLYVVAGYFMVTLEFVYSLISAF